MDAAAANMQLEKLVATIGRAFYTDPHIIVLDTLLREKYIRLEEIGPRLKMSSKEIRTVLTQLENDMLIHSENMILEDGSSARYLYIDYQLFVNVVRYRIHLMTADIKQAQRSELTDVVFQCPNCKQTYHQLEAQKYLAADLKFVCPNCCPHDNIRANRSEDSYRLVEVNNVGKLTDIQVFAKRMDEQLHAQSLKTETQSKKGSNSSSNSNNINDGNNAQEFLLHEGILELLAELKDVPLIRNRPSDNRLRGISTSKITDEDVRKDAIESIGLRKLQKEAKFAGAGRMGTHVGMTIMGEDVGADEFTVTLHDESSPRDAAHSGAYGGSLKRPRDYQYPEFLKNSRVAATSNAFLNAAGASSSSTDGSSTQQQGGESKSAAAEEEDENKDSAAEDVDWET
jgi:transcription initiation factor IIE alpha subunit